MSDDKPRGAQEGWERKRTGYPFRTEWLTVRQDTVEIHGEEKQFSYMESAPGVIIVPVTRDGQVLLLRQYRYPLDRWVLELPAGSTFDREQSSLEESARVELRQELGAEAAELRHIGSYFTSPGKTDEAMHIFVALGTKVAAQPERELMEDMESQSVPIPDALAMARDGRIAGAPSALALLAAEPILRDLMRED